MTITMTMTNDVDVYLNKCHNFCTAMKNFSMIILSMLLSL